MPLTPGNGNLLHHKVRHHDAWLPNNARCWDANPPDSQKPIVCREMIFLHVKMMQQKFHHWRSEWLKHLICTNLPTNPLRKIYHKTNTKFLMNLAPVFQQLWPRPVSTSGVTTNFWVVGNFLHQWLVEKSSNLQGFFGCFFLQTTNVFTTNLPPFDEASDVFFRCGNPDSSLVIQAVGKTQPQQASGLSVASKKKNTPLHIMFKKKHII